MPGKKREEPKKERADRRDKAPKRIIHLSGKLACSRCTNGWTVVDLNPERKVVPCPVCAEPNYIREAIKRAA
jgi:NAD-dependent SIR2 family protein deacetylase